MGTVGTELLRDLRPEDVWQLLLGMYAHEKLTVAMLESAELQLAGMPEIIAKDAVKRMAKAAGDHADMLAERISRLGGAIPYDPSDYRKLSPIDISDVPDPNNMRQVGSYVLDRERQAIRHYNALLERMRDKDLITYFEVLPILKYHVDMEDELQSFMEAESSAKGS